MVNVHAHVSLIVFPRSWSLWSIVNADRCMESEQKCSTILEGECVLPLHHQCVQRWYRKLLPDKQQTACPTKKWWLAWTIDDPFVINFEVPSVQNEWQRLKPNCVDKGKFSHCRLFSHQSFLPSWIPFCSFTHLCLQLPLHSFTHGIVHAFIRACIHFPLQLVFHSHSSMYIFPNSSPMRSSIDSLIASHFFVQSIIHSFIRLFVHFFFRSEIVQTFSDPPVHSYVHSIIHLFCHSLAHSLTDSLIFVSLPFLFVFFLMFIMFFHPFIISLTDRFFIFDHSLWSWCCHGEIKDCSFRWGRINAPPIHHLAFAYSILFVSASKINSRTRLHICVLFIQSSPDSFEGASFTTPRSCNLSPSHMFIQAFAHPLHSVTHAFTYLFMHWLHWLTHQVAYSLIHSRICGFSQAVNFILTWFFVSHSPLQLFEKECGHFGVAEFWPHRTSVTSPVSHVVCPSQKWHGTSRVSDIIDRSQAHFLSHNNQITHQSHHPQTLANTVPSHTHNTRIPSHITHISRHTSFTSPTSHITCHFQRPDFNSQRSNLSAHIHQIAFDLTLVLRLHTYRQPI